MTTTKMANLLLAAIDGAGWRAPPGDPATPADYLGLLTPLYETGRRDLPLGRLLEGHIDAGQIVQRYATPAQRDLFRRAAGQGATLGVWNAALPGEPLRLDAGRLTGGKAYASGAGVISHALVVADTPAGNQLILLDLARVPPVIDRDWWRVTGMGRSETHLVRWPGLPVDDASLIGAPGDYATEPWFSGGALRFVAVHAGGIAGLFDRVRAHLIETGRADDGFQAARLATLFELAQLAAATVRRSAECWFGEEGEGRLARTASARLTVADAAERAITLAQQAVGLAGMFVDHPLSAMLADLAVYLRQPVPDAQRLRVGRAAAAGALVPRL